MRGMYFNHVVSYDDYNNYVDIQSNIDVDIKMLKNVIHYIYIVYIYIKNEIKTIS
jgi:hypothetical protein